MCTYQLQRNKTFMLSTHLMSCSSAQWQVGCKFMFDGITVLWYKTSCVIFSDCLCSKMLYTISSIMHAFWFVLTYDLLEDRRIDDSESRLKFDSGVNFLNQIQSLTTHSNQWVCFILYNQQITSNRYFLVCQRRERTRFRVTLKTFEINKLFLNILFLYYIKQIDSMFPCVCSVIDVGYRLVCHILTSSVIYYWTDAQQHGIYLFNSLTPPFRSFQRRPHYLWSFGKGQLKFVAVRCRQLRGWWRWW